VSEPLSFNFESNAQRQHEVEQFYYREARLLDNRQLQQWLALAAEDIQYLMPSRVNVSIDNRDRGNESMISVENELERSDQDGCPIREENIFHLSLRVERAYKINSWAENPPARTRRIIGNVEVTDCSDIEMSVLSNFILHYSRPGSANFSYSGQRRDTLRPTAEGYSIARREVIMDYATINVPTLGLIF